MWIGLTIGVWTLFGAGLLGQWVLRRKLRRFRGVVPDPLPRLDVYAYAYLCGGRRRTAQTALAALHLTGRITVELDRIVLTGASAGSGHPVEEAALAACTDPGRFPRPPRPRRAEKRAKHSSAVRQVGEALARDGLIRPPVLHQRAESWGPATATSLLLVASALGISAAIVEGVSHRWAPGQPAAVITWFACMALVLAGFRTPEPGGPTPEGSRVIEEQRDPAESDGPDGPALRRVAFDGPAAQGMPADLSRLLYRAPPSTFQPDGGPGLGGI
ncbi:TIGR04222 domain-containing membrane protein [Streptomyces sp. NPDC051546]|uniref:TIGR04222 domain-containing membrane protein n=1 Tax=Streptomyces sp. NPDC051546 TaxID=3365655 RepID=UPI0037AFA12E